MFIIWISASDSICGGRWQPACRAETCFTASNSSTRKQALVGSDCSAANPARANARTYGRSRSRFQKGRFRHVFRHDQHRGQAADFVSNTNSFHGPARPFVGAGPNAEIRQKCPGVTDSFSSLNSLGDVTIAGIADPRVDIAVRTRLTLRPY